MSIPTRGSSSTLVRLRCWEWTFRNRSGGSGQLGFGVNRVLRDLHGQDRFFQDVQRCEGEGSASGPDGRYRWVVFTRADAMWFASHPALTLFDEDHVWVPDACDHFVGITEHHAVVPRRHAEAFFSRYQSLASLEAAFAACGTSAAIEAEALSHGCLAERYLRCHLRRLRVPVARFLPVAALARESSAVDCSSVAHAICPSPGQTGCSHFIRDYCDGTLASSVAVRLRWGWRWQMVWRRQVHIYPPCDMGDEAVLSDCCDASLSEIWQNLLVEEESSQFLLGCLGSILHALHDQSQPRKVLRAGLQPPGAAQPADARGAAPARATRVGCCGRLTAQPAPVLAYRETWNCRVGAWTFVHL
ncbi:unnamed protein product [Polarella glacialis]|uniref:Uncharacterized protein n=1 Tax=Polarella glacialis TaxID=89957 RepID=A0A813F4M3_POLGL|nr:unnamed protein product [Polarella glacialis]